MSLTEYKELRKRLKTLREMLRFLEESCTENEARLQESIERNGMARLAASQLANQLGEMKNDLDYANVGLTNARKRLLEAPTSDEECV